MDNGHRRVLYTEERVRALFARMRDELNEMAVRHASEVAVLRTELDEIRAQFDELRAVSLARQRAHAELVGLHRERAIQRARAAERDASTPREHDPKRLQGHRCEMQHKRQRHFAFVLRCWLTWFYPQVCPNQALSGRQSFVLPASCRAPASANHPPE